MATDPLTRLITRLVGTDLLIVAAAFRRRREFDVVLAMEERIGIALGVLMRVVRTRPRQVMVVHRITASWKSTLMTLFRLHWTIDAFLVYGD